MQTQVNEVLLVGFAYAGAVALRRFRLRGSWSYQAVLPADLFCNVLW